MPKTFIRLIGAAHEMLWASAFASAVVALRDWTPEDGPHGHVGRQPDIEQQRRARCVALAHFAVDQYIKAEKESRDYIQAVDHKKCSGNVTIDLTGERIFMGVVMALTFHTVTLVGDCTLELIEPQSGVHYELRLFVRQDEVGGHKITWPSRIQWSARPGVPAKSSPGSTPLLTATPGATDSVTIARNGLGEYATAVSYDYRPGP
jgi:hypothetical protein